MKGVLYVGHGSSYPEGRQEAVDFLHAVRKQVDVKHQEISFLELAEPNMEQGMERLIAAGATNISIIPMLLLSAGHDKQDIPEQVRMLEEKYAGVTFSYGRPLGVQDRLIAILQERIEEQQLSRHEDAKVLIIGRGSSHPQTKKDIESIGQKFQARTGFRNVDVCYLAARKPSFKEALTDAIQQGHSQIYVVPYIWFTGYLMHVIETNIKALDVHHQVVLCRHLGDHPLMQQALKERVEEVVHDKGKSYEPDADHD